MYQLEISSKKNNSRYKYFHMIKLGTTSEKKKKILLFYLFFYVKNFERKIFKKLSVNWRYRVKTIILDISTFT